jgi:hypothetical protein
LTRRDRNAARAYRFARFACLVACLLRIREAGRILAKAGLL